MERFPEFDAWPNCPWDEAHDLIRKLEEAGCQFVRHGGNHDWYRNPKTGILSRCPVIGRSTSFWQSTS